MLKKVAKFVFSYLALNLQLLFLRVIIGVIFKKNTEIVYFNTTQEFLNEHSVENESLHCAKI